MSERQNGRGSAPLRLDDLVVLNQEIAALVKAGIPLELGLRTLSGGVSHSLGELTQRLADRLSNGLSLTQALDQEGPQVSPVYTAVVGAGLETGRLDQALESLTSSSRVISESRDRVMMSLVYPAIVATLAFVLFWWFVAVVVPGYLATAKDFACDDHWVFQSLGWLRETQPVWGTLIPTVVLVAIAFSWWRGRSGFGDSVLNLFPGMGVVRRLLNWAQFAELLSLQLTHGLPLPSSLRRAAEGTTNASLVEEAHRVGAELERGRSLADTLSKASLFPPMMRWIMTSAEQQGTLDSALKMVAETYRRQALFRAGLFRVWTPILITIFVTGTIALLYGLVLFLPLRAVWEGIMRE